MNQILQRFGKIAEAFTNKSIDQLEEPIMMIEQAMRDLNTQLSNAIRNFAELKASATRLQMQLDEAMNNSNDCENKAAMILVKAKKGEIPMEKAEEFAKQFLSDKNKYDKQANQFSQDYSKQNDAVKKWGNIIENLKNRIESQKNELIMLKSRARSAEATIKINKELSNVDPNGTIGLLERMKEKIGEREAYAESLGQIANQQLSADEKYKNYLGDADVSDSLKELKTKIGLLELPEK